MESDLGKLFVGGISWDTDEERLRGYFSKYGEVVEAVIMRDRATGRARGFGFIVFADPCVAERVIMEKHMIDGRTVEAKKAVPRDDQQGLKQHASPVHHMSPPGHGGGRTKKIFVGGLPSSITEAEFKNYFNQFGSISDVVVMYDHNTQRPRGFGFITYDSEDSVDRVLHKTFHELNGKMVEVKRAVPKELSPSPAPSNRSPVLGYGNYGGPNRASANIYLNSFSPGYNVNSVGRFSPIGSGRTAFSGFGLDMNLDLSLNHPSYDGTTPTFGNSPGYGRILSNPYYNGAASPNRYNTPIGYNRIDPPAYSSGNRDLWANRTDSTASGGSGWSLGGVSIGNNRGSWGLSSVPNGNNGHPRNFGTGSGLSVSSFSGTNGLEGSIGELYRGGSVYNDPTWQQPPLPPQSSDELDGLSSRPFSYTIGNVGLDPSSNGSEGYTGSYSVGDRQTHRGIAT
ncbi:PREDICTED: heterogeneous nuclear ribonucleoprotein 1-like [Tarenaya hassleriana]|uniref:heterogeneous nuclear ribonucleoprotein 1-like n=1 Tax=Tarenaya hassleriana TaxID=28532 RepID=UPI00053C335A|nr:PREDICTED: heterogeneous nuclear ribonucleoprotein 1-like [Tarenaya hassleriana]